MISIRNHAGLDLINAEDLAKLGRSRHTCVPMLMHVQRVQYLLRGVSVLLCLAL